MSESLNQNFNHLKVHTQYSICEGAAKIDDLQEYCKSNKIKSLGIEITQVAGNLHAEFSEGSFQIKNVGSTTRGYGKKIYINSEDDKIILEEQAQLDQDGFVIKSDLIHYDYNLNKILKSINSSIENNL